MNTKSRWRPAIITLLLAFAGSAGADDVSGQAPVRADSHGPIGVMGDHMHKKGEWMLSYTFMRMEMDGNQIGHGDVSPDFIVTNISNRFGPLRIVPLTMTMDMHMFGAMYAPSDNITLMAMANYVDKEMYHVTYDMMGNAPIGNFTTDASGWGDTYLGGLFRLYDSEQQKWHINFGVTAPTGSQTETGTILAPNGGMPTVRLPYPMQLGSGTWDVKPGITYNGRSNNVTWGAQYMGTFRLGENDEDYTLGNVQQVTAWGAFSPSPWWSYSLRIAYEDVDKIDGQDPNIAGPVQTAEPDFFGGESLYGYFGLNFAGQSGWLRGQRIAFEYGAPISQDLDGPQMAQDYTVTVGWQYAF